MSTIFRGVVPFRFAWPLALSLLSCSPQIALTDTRHVPISLTQLPFAPESAGAARALAALAARAMTCLIFHPRRGPEGLLLERKLAAVLGIKRYLPVYRVNSRPRLSRGRYCGSQALLWSRSARHRRSRRSLPMAVASLH